MMQMILASLENLNDCYEALNNSRLFDEYFQNAEKCKSFLLDGIKKNEIYIAKNNMRSIGFMRIDEIGMFSKYPLLRLIVVKQEYRNKGLGSEMLRFYETKYKNKADRIFLCVSSFNDDAKRLYTSLGFNEVGRIDGLYKKGVIEYLLMKEL